MIIYSSSYLKIGILTLLCALHIFSPPVALPSSLVVDEINIIAVRDMQLRKEGRDYFMDVVCVVRNTGKSILKFQKCNFKLSFAAEKDILIGPASKDEVLIGREENSPHTDTDVRFVTPLGTDIQKFHAEISASEQLSSLILDTAPRFNLHIRGEFNVGIGMKQGWVYLKGITIDWILALDVPRDVFVKTYKAIERAAGKGDEPSDDALDIFETDPADQTEKRQ